MNVGGRGMKMQTDLMIALQNEFLFEMLKQRTYLTNDKPQERKKKEEQSRAEQNRTFSLV